MVGWSRAVHILELIIPHYQVRPSWVLYSVPHELWVFSVWLVETITTSYVRTRHSSLSSFEIVISPTLGSLFPFMLWYEFWWIIKGHPLQSFRILSLSLSFPWHSVLQNLSILVSPVPQLCLPKSETPPCSLLLCFPITSWKPDGNKWDSHWVYLFKFHCAPLSDVQCFENCCFIFVVLKKTF